MPTGGPALARGRSPPVTNLTVACRPQCANRKHAPRRDASGSGHASEARRVGVGPLSCFLLRRHCVSPGVAHRLGERYLAPECNARAAIRSDCDEFLPAAVRVGTQRSPLGHKVHVNRGRGAAPEGPCHVAGASTDACQHNLLRALAGLSHCRSARPRRRHHGCLDGDAG